MSLLMKMQGFDWLIIGFTYEFDGFTYENATESKSATTVNHWIIN